MLLRSDRAGCQNVVLLLDIHCCLFKPAVQPLNVHFNRQVLAMNQAFAEERRGMSGMDASSRHLLGQRQNVTAAPWNVAREGHKVRPALCQLLSSMLHVLFQSRSFILIELPTS